MAVRMRDTCPHHVDAHGHPTHLKCWCVVYLLTTLECLPLMSSHLSTINSVLCSITPSFVPSPPSMAHKSAIPTPNSGIRLCLWLRVDAPCASANLLFHLSLPYSSARCSLVFGSSSSPLAIYVPPQSSQTHSYSSAMLVGVHM